MSFWKSCAKKTSNPHKQEHLLDHHIPPRTKHYRTTSLFRPQVHIDFSSHGHGSNSKSYQCTSTNPTTKIGSKMGEFYRKLGSRLTANDHSHTTAWALGQAAGGGGALRGGAQVFPRPEPSDGETEESRGTRNGGAIESATNGSWSFSPPLPS